MEERSEAMLSWYLGPVGLDIWDLPFAWGQPFHPGNLMNSLVISGTLDNEHSICGKKIAKDCLSYVLLSREPLMCFK